MVSACSNWVGVRADCLFSVLTTAAAFGFSFLLQDQGKGFNGQVIWDGLLLLLQSSTASLCLVNKGKEYS